VKEMAELLCLEMVEKGLVTDSITLHIGYNNRYEMKSAHGSVKMTVTTNSAKRIREEAVALYERIMDRYTPIRRFHITFNRVIDERYQQYDLFTDVEEMEREQNLQRAVLDIKERFGKNAVLKGMNLQEGATTIERNRQIGGHRSGT
jgi:DNA polymerase V